MSFRFVGYFAAFTVAIALLCIAGSPLYGQISSGTIVGTIVDQSGQSVPNAKVELFNEDTGTIDRTITTGENGGFLFASVSPGKYTVRVEAGGFQRFERKENNLVSGDRLSLGDIQLSVGALTETISVVAQGAQVQTASSESSTLITAQQLDTIGQKGRTITNYLLLLPGFNTNLGTLDAASSFITVPNANGLSNLMTAISIDGFQGADTTSPQLFVTNINPDAIGEMTIMTNNYQAEFGRNGGASANIITKSGTRDFHGTAYYYKRHEMFNANDFFLNRAGRPKSIYRFETRGLSIGGPVVGIPYTRGRDKLFFFYNWDQNPSLQKDRVIATLPTLAERGGDFSKSLSPSGALIVIRDPKTGVPFPGNLIPANRINANGQRLLGVFTPPNALDRSITSGAYNNDTLAVNAFKRLQHIYRIDYRPSEKDSINFRGAYFVTANDQEMARNQPATGIGWNFSEQTFRAPNKTWVMGWTHIISPRIVNEWTGGIRRPREFFIPEPRGEFAQRKTYGLTIGQFQPNKNPLGVLPLVTFAGGGLQNLPNFGNFGGGRYGYTDGVNGYGTEADFTYYWQNNITINRGSHTYKAGIYFEKQRETEGPGLGQNPFGNFDFGVDANNPNDARHPYANVLLGNFRSYTESQLRERPAAVTSQFEWFVQDSWKVTRRLTLDIGVRSVYFTPYYAWNGKGTAFVSAKYDRSQVPALYQPALVNGSLVAFNPLNNSTASSSLIGFYVNGAPGNPGIGTTTSKDPSIPHGFINQDGWHFQPRFGFAYDVFGNGKTAIRGGFSAQNQILRYANRPASAPISYDPVVFWGNLDTFLGAAGSIAPGNTFSFEQDKPTPTIYNISLGVQRDVGRQTIVDVKYVSTLARHLATFRELEALPYGTRFLPSSINPRTGSLYPDTFLRPILGWNSISSRESGGSSYYHSLQVTANRRFSSGFQYGVSYTFSKAMDYTEGVAPPREGSLMPTYATAAVFAKGKAGFDQTHLFAFNYTYSIPNMSKRMSGGSMKTFVHHALDNWEISGITTFSSGVPFNAGIFTVSNNAGTQSNLTLTDGADLLGGGDGIRAILTCNPNLSHGERGVDRMFNTSCFARPIRGAFGGLGGNVGNGIVRGPGVINWDATVFKRFPLRTERQAFEFRWEAYNVFNHTQFSNMNAVTSFNATGAQTNAAFGQATANRPPRVMQGALRFRF